MDEKAHRVILVMFVDKLCALPEGEAAGGEAAPPDPVALDVLDKGIRHEYTVILQYLWHSFVTPDCEISRELEMQAINEMQHLGWLAEEMAGLGGPVEIERTAVNQSADTAEMLAADIRAEREVTKVYSEQLNKIQDEGLKSLIARIRDHEIYHDAVFSDLLQSLQKGSEKAPSPTKGFTVGSLKE
jgi:bacterioferritin